MIQIYGKTILLMEFKSIIKAHDSNSWQYYFINGIQPHNQISLFKPMANYLSKTQFSLATSKYPIFIGNIKKPNFHWQHQKPNFHWQHQKPSFHWQHKKNSVLISNIKSPIFISNIKNPIFVGNIKSLVFAGNIKKPSFHWQYQKVQFTLALFYQKPKIINAWQKYYVIIISFKRLCRSFFGQYLGQSRNKDPGRFTYCFKGLGLVHRH